MQRFEGVLGAVFVGGSAGEDGAAGERGEVELATHFELLLGEAVEVVVTGELDARDVRGEGLDGDLAFERVAAEVLGDD
ncbi:hypothetical protein [Haloferula helveola]|uniref:hypothetical protein n=1 Tax=Haloferula helveola TaxID=490095 RepID=UPI0030D31372